MKYALFTDKVTFVNNPKAFTKNTASTSKFRKASEYKVKIQKNLLHFHLIAKSQRDYFG